MSKIIRGFFIRWRADIMLWRISLVVEAFDWSPFVAGGVLGGTLSRKTSKMTIVIIAKPR